MAATAVTVLLEELELVEGRSDKYYRAWTYGHIVVFQWGRRGTVGQHEILVGSSAAAAARAVSAKLQAKRARGYRDAADDCLTITLNLDLSLSHEALWAQVQDLWQAEQARLWRERLATLAEALADGTAPVVTALHRLPNEERSMPWVPPALELLSELSRGGSCGMAVMSQRAAGWFQQHWRGGVEFLGPAAPGDSPVVYETALALRETHTSLDAALSGARLVLGA